MASIQNGERAGTANYAVKRVKMIPAFARKYGLRCSACHTVWPELNSFGQQFRDNGYQLQNEREALGLYLTGNPLSEFEGVLTRGLRRLAL